MSASSSDSDLLWPAPTASAPLRATVDVPGSKSLTNRYLALAAIADGPGRVTEALRSRDSELMIAALAQLGITTTDTRDDVAIADWEVTPGQIVGGGRIDCGLAGTVMRFLPPIAALAAGPVFFDGDDGARLRPMGKLLDALVELGASVEYHGEAGFLPFTITGPGTISGGELVIDSSETSQYVSALLMAAPLFKNGLDLRHNGEHLPSIPHITMTVAVLREAGVQIDEYDLDTPNPRWVVHPGPIQARTWRVEPDLSNAGPFLAAAVVAGGEVSVPGWPTHTTQPGALLPGILEQIGAEYTLADDVLTVRGTGTIRGLDLDLSAAGELAPTITAILALADTPSQLRGIGHLRGHETDRLAALRAEINGLGGLVVETDDGLIIEPKPLHGGVFHTYADHRMATAASIIGLQIPGIQVENIRTTSKTMPNFVELWEKMLSL